MIRLRSNWRNLSVLTWDLACVGLAILLANFTRFDGVIPVQYIVPLKHQLMFGLPVYLVTFLVFGVNKGIWRYSSVGDLWRILKAIAISNGLTVLAMFIFKHTAGLELLSRSVLFLTSVYLLMFMGGSRLIARLVSEHRWFRIHPARNVVIYGAGRDGQRLLREIRQRRQLGMEVLCFLDDNPGLKNRLINGVQIRGSLEILQQLLEEQIVDEVLVGIPHLKKDRFRRIVEICEGAGILCRTLPSLAESTNKKLGISQLRPISVEDLLGRDAVVLDTQLIDSFIHNKTVLVTGAGGSIGSELCRQVLMCKPKQLILLDQCEFHLYQIEKQLANHQASQIVGKLGDVKDAQSMEQLFACYRPHVVFHAAAYKHVPMLEDNPAEGVLNNVLGTQVISVLASRFGAEKFVLVSTDKAVNPVSVMGASKRVAEIYCQNLDSQSSTAFITTRFGNVLGSTGSVVPLFQEQIANGGPVTVTHPNVVRFFMTISEAVGLILQAGAMGSGGEIFVLDMGEPLRIKHLAEQMIRLSGFEIDRDVEIQYTGLRAGEKLFEELFHEHEGLRGTEHSKLLLADARKVEPEWLKQQLTVLIQKSRESDAQALMKQLQVIVPEYHSVNYHLTGMVKTSHQHYSNIVSFPQDIAEHGT
ncbi:MAG: polysaccharide biosynthesis protein [Gammaproteobacteria bacterium]|nr:polysaccharide biosynthesis protein [Gammaproteobacteria bacterium]